MANPQPIQWAQLLKLPEQPALPLQGRLRLVIVQAILTGRLGSGAALPSSRKLATLLGLSRNTVTSAYLQLADEGFLVARPRSGVVVAPNSRPRSPTQAEPMAGARGQPSQVLQICFARWPAEFRPRNLAHDCGYSAALPEQRRVRLLNPSTEDAGGTLGSSR